MIRVLVTLRCDGPGCGKETFGTAKLPGWLSSLDDVRLDDVRPDADGWQCADGRQLCPECAPKLADELRREREKAMPL